MTSTTITNFAAKHIRFGKNLSVNTVDVVNAYITFNKGSTAGKLKLYAYLQSIENVSKVRTEFFGLELIQETTQPVIETKQPIPQQTEAPKMSEFEIKCLELKEAKIRSQEEMKVKELKVQEEMKAKELKALEEMKVMKIRSQERMKASELLQQQEIEEMKMRFKAECFNKTMDFQREVNNQNRYLNAGFVDRKTEYIAIGTASNVHIEYDSAIDNLNELEYGEDLKEPIKQCFKNQTVDLKMVDEKIERGIPLTAMINIHQFIINKLDTNELSDQIKQKIICEYEKEEYTEVQEIVENIEVDVGETKNYISISNNEISKLKKIESDALLYARVHSKAYERALDENKKMSEKLGRKSMLPIMDYIVPENNIRCVGRNIIVDCYCCGSASSIKDCHRSHVVAKELGGSCDKDNIRVCCKDCNIGMGMMDLEAYKSTLSKE